VYFSWKFSCCFLLLILSGISHLNLAHDRHGLFGDFVLFSAQCQRFFGYLISNSPNALSKKGFAKEERDVGQQRQQRDLIY